MRLPGYNGLNINGLGGFRGELTPKALEPIRDAVGERRKQSLSFPNVHPLDSEANQAYSVKQMPVYSPEIAAEICERLAKGESLRTICDSDSRFPTETAVRKWAIEDRDGFASQYAGARDIGLDVVADEILRIADETENDIIETEKGPVVNREVIQRSVLRVDARKWYLSKLAPKRYGDRSQVAVTDAEGNAAGFMFGIISAPKQIEGK